MKRLHHQSGFSLIEVSLALLVVGVGILSAFALFPTGLNTGRKAGFESDASLFANGVFNTYRGFASMNVTNWASINNSFALGAPCVGMADYQGPSTIQPGQFVLFTNAFKGMPQVPFRYRLDIGTVTAAGVIPDTVKYLMLTVWQGAYGPTNTVATRTYYTEVPAP